MGVRVGENVLALERAQHRHLELLGKGHQLVPGARVLGAGTRQQHRPLGPVDALHHLPDQFRIRTRTDRGIGAHHGDVRLFLEHIPGEGDHHGAWTPRARHVERPGHDTRHLPRVVDLDDPLGDAAEEMRVVDLLAGLPAPVRPGHLADEQDQRRRVVLGKVHADAGIGGAWAPRDHAHPRRPGGLAVGLGHEARAALVPVGDEGDLGDIPHAVQQGEVALARHGEGVAHAFVA